MTSTSHPRSIDTLESIRRLKKLKPRLGGANPQARIEFASLVFQNDLYRDIVSYEMYDEFNLGGRDLDCCFEMWDGEIVVHGVMVNALNNQSVRIGIESMGGDVWNRWLDIYTKNECQMGLFN